MSDINCDDETRVLFNIPYWLTYFISDLNAIVINDRQIFWCGVSHDDAGYTQLVLGFSIRRKYHWTAAKTLVYVCIQRKARIHHRTP